MTADRESTEFTKKVERTENAEEKIVFEIQRLRVSSVASVYLRFSSYRMERGKIRGMLGE